MGHRQNRVAPPAAITRVDGERLGRLRREPRPSPDETKKLFALCSREFLEHFPECLYILILLSLSGADAHRVSGHIYNVNGEVVMQRNSIVDGLTSE